MSNFEDKVRLDPCFREQMSNIGPADNSRVYEYEAKEFTLPPVVTKEDLAENMRLKWLRRTIKK